MADLDAQAFLANAADRYSTLEAAYCQDNWPEVVTQGRKLLADLEGTEDPLALALRVRAHLLMGHAFLHGLGNRDAAEDHYRLVLNTAGAEAALRRSAEEGLQTCNRPVVRPEQATIPAQETIQDSPTAAEEPPAAESPTGEHPLPQAVAPDLVLESGTAVPGQPQEAATPWLQAQASSQAASTPLIPDLVEEPELLEVRRAEEPDEVQLDTDVDQAAAAAAARLLAASARASALIELGVTDRGEQTDARPGDELRVDARPGEGLLVDKPSAAEPGAMPEASLSLQKASVIDELRAAMPASDSPSAEAEMPPAFKAEELVEEEPEEEEFDLDLLEGLLQVTLA